MPTLPTHLLKAALTWEGGVNVWRPDGERFYRVGFRFNGKFVNRSTGCTERDAADARGTEIFAEVVRGPKEAATLANLQQQLNELTTLVQQLVKNGISGALPTGPLIPQTVFQARDEFDSAQKKQTKYVTWLKVSGRVRRLCAFLGDRPLTDVTQQQVDAYLGSKAWAGKTRGHEISAAKSFFKFCVKQKWLTSSPAAEITKPRNAASSSMPEVLTTKQIIDLLQYIELIYPHWLLFYVIAIFSGARANKITKAERLREEDSGGEITRLLDAVKVHGWGKFTPGLQLRLPEGKVGQRPRQIWFPDALRAYLAAYPSSLEAPTPTQHTTIAKDFGIPPNAFRHTAASLYIANGGTIATATLLFQTSEGKLSGHYLNLISPEDAKTILAIRPIQSEAVANLAPVAQEKRVAV